MKIPKISKENRVGNQAENLLALVGTTMTKSVSFMNTKVDIKKLSVAQVLEIQELAKDAAEETSDNFALLRFVMNQAVEGAEDLTDEQFQTFPMDELSSLSGEIMKFSGMGEDKKGK